MPDLINIDTKAAAKRVEDAERVPVFSIDGVVYDVAKVERADIGLEYLARVEEDGLQVAESWLIRTTVGDEGFQALRNVVGLSPDDWQGVMDKIQAVVSPKARGTRG